MIILVLYFISNLFAAEIPEPFIGVRPTGMGGAFTSIANDQNAVWANPAGISRTRKARSRHGINLISVPNLIVGANSQGQSFSEDFQKARLENTGAELIENIQTALESAKNLNNKPLWGRAAINPMIYFDAQRGSPFAFGLYSDAKTNVLISKSDTSETGEVEGSIDFGAVFSMGMTNRTNRFSFGIQIRPIQRYSYNDKIDLASLLNKKEMEDRIKADSNVTSTVAIDVGLLMTYPDFWFPSLGIAIYNLPTGCVKDYLNPFSEIPQTICGAKHTGEINNPEALDIIDPTEIKIGISILPRLHRKFGLRFAIDVHHLYMTDGVNYYGLPGIEVSNQIRGGLELFFGNPSQLTSFALRAGYSQGFATFGATFRISRISLDIATYGQNVSLNSSAEEDRRTILSLSTEF